MLILKCGFPGFWFGRFSDFARGTGLGLQINANNIQIGVKQLILYLTKQTFLHKKIMFEAHSHNK